MNSSTDDQYAVMGNPIGHSKSPLIHSLFAAQTKQHLNYSAIEVALGGFAAAVAAFHAAGGKGLNVTVPFKQEAWQLTAARTPRAERAGAVNTLWWDASDQLHGDTTDGVGLVRDLRLNHGIALKNRNILLMGAGGAARGVIEPLLAESPARLLIANRTAAKAHELAALFAEFGPVYGCGFAELDGQRFDLVINATAAGLAGEVPPLPATIFREGAWSYDMMYGSEPTAFVRWSRAQGAQALDGLGMLVEQAAEAFAIWRGIRPDTAAVIERLRAPAA